MSVQAKHVGRMPSGWRDSVVVPDFPAATSSWTTCPMCPSVGLVFSNFQGQQWLTMTTLG